MFSAIYYQFAGVIQTYPCDTCGRQYRRRITLQRHKKLECGKEAQFECMICHAKFKHKHSLQRHYNIHQDDVSRGPSKTRTSFDRSIGKRLYRQRIQRWRDNRNSRTTEQFRIPNTHKTEI